MKLDQKTLSDFNVYTKYAKYIPAQKRRESWEEVCYRNLAMHTEKFKHLGTDFVKEIYNVYENFVIPKKVLPSIDVLCNLLENQSNYRQIEYTIVLICQLMR